MTKNYEKLAHAIDWIVANKNTTASLEKIATQFNFEPRYFQKLFKSYVGVSPKQFQRYMHYHHARHLLLNGMSTLDTAYESGLSGQGRLHDLFLTIESMTPGDIKKRGKNITILYGFASTCLGEIMIAKTQKGICWIGFQVNESRNIAIQRMHSFWPLANFHEGDISEEADKINTIWQGKTLNSKLPLDIYGTNMQIQVWQALLRIPFGHAVDYKSIAHHINKPTAARAVGNAVGSNPISLLIPCHRVIQASGILNNYGWGSERKKIILGVETQIEGLAPHDDTLMPFD